MLSKIIILLVLILTCNAMAKNEYLSNGSAKAQNSLLKPPEVVIKHESKFKVLPPKNLFDGNNKSELFLSATSAILNSGNGQSNILLSSMYTYLIDSHIQLGGQLTMGALVSVNGESLNGAELYALGIYNFSTEIKESFFSFLGIGTGLGDLDSHIRLKIGGGKRFPLVSQVQFVPMVWIHSIQESDPIISLLPVNFSLIF